MTICNSRLGLWVWRDIICIWTTMKTRTPDLLSIWAAQAPTWCTAQAMPMTSDNTQLWTRSIVHCTMSMKIDRNRKDYIFYFKCSTQSVLISLHSYRRPNLIRTLSTVSFVSSYWNSDTYLYGIPYYSWKRQLFLFRTRIVSIRGIIEKEGI